VAHSANRTGAAGHDGNGGPAPGATALPRPPGAFPDLAGPQRFNVFKTDTLRFLGSTFRIAFSSRTFNDVQLRGKAALALVAAPLLSAATCSLAKKIGGSRVTGAPVTG